MSNLIQITKFSLFRTVICYSILALIVSEASSESARNEIAIKNFRDYLQIKTAHFDPDYDSAIAWIQGQAEGLGLKYNILRFSEETKDKFAVWLTWQGLNPSLQSVLLYSHIDVVAAVNSEWKHDPFGAEMDENGNIYGRGSQDMKSAAVQYLEAIRNLKAKGVTPNRTIHVGFFPDEEVGGWKGIKLFVRTPEFTKLNIGFVLDEGIPSNDPTKYNIYYAQRQVIWPKFTAVGESGHGSLLLNNTAAEKIHRVITKLLNLRETEKLRYESNSSVDIGVITTINLNILEGGMEANIIPANFSATFDIRLPPSANYNEVMKFLDDTCAEAGTNVTYKIIHTSLLPDRELPITKLEKDAWWWINIQKAFQKMNLSIEPKVLPATSDGQTLRNEGIPTLEFSPIYNSSMHMHGRDEYLNVDVFLRGIEIYETLIQSLAYAPPGTVDKKPSPGKSSSPARTISATMTTWICTCLIYYLLTTFATQS